MLADSAGSSPIAENILAVLCVATFENVLPQSLRLTSNQQLATSNQQLTKCAHGEAAGNTNNQHHTQKTHLLMV